MTDTTWTNGGGDGLASNPANWSNGIDVGYNHIFDGTSVDNCTFDLDIELGTLTIAAGYTGIVLQSSDMHISAFLQQGGVFTGNVLKWVYCSSDFTVSAGTFAVEKSNIELTGIGKSLSAAIRPYQLIISGSYTISAAKEIYFPNGGVIKVSGSLVLGHASATIVLLPDATNVRESQNSINGCITGIGYIEIFTQSDNKAICGDYHGVAVNVKIDLRSGANGNKTITMGRAQSFMGPVNLWSAHATYILTVNSNGYSIAASTITTGVRGILINSATTDSTVTVKSFDSSAGTFTPDRTVLVMEGASTLKLAAGGSVDNLISKGVTTLASDVIVANVCAHVNPISKGAFALTLTKPENEYTGLRRPIVRTVKRLDIGTVGLADAWLQCIGGIL